MKKLSYSFLFYLRQLCFICSSSVVKNGVTSSAHSGNQEPFQCKLVFSLGALCKWFTRMTQKIRNKQKHTIIPHFTEIQFLTISGVTKSSFPWAFLTCFVWISCGIAVKIQHLESVLQSLLVIVLLHWLWNQVRSCFEEVTGVAKEMHVCSFQEVTGSLDHFLTMTDKRVMILLLPFGLVVAPSQSKLIQWRT